MVSLLFAAALALNTPAPQAAPADFAVSSPDSILAIPADVDALLLQRVGRNVRQEKRRLELLVDFMFKEDGLGMKYQGDATYTVEQAVRTRRANCLSFTLLTVALARRVGLHAYAKEIDQVLAWEHVGNSVIQSTHVNATVEAEDQRYTVDVARDTVILGSPPRRIDDTRLLALYYGNRAMETMLAGRLDDADTYARAALALQRDDATLWSNYGVLHSRMGQSLAARDDYLKALSLDRRHTGALFNLASYYRRNGDDARAEALRKRAEKVIWNDPFHQFVLGMETEQKGEYADALRHYRRAVRLYDKEHLFYFGLARTYWRLGEPQRADRALVRAYTLSDGGERDRYQAKLQKLKQMGF